MAAGDFTVGGYDLDNVGFEVVDLPDWKLFLNRKWQDAVAGLRDARRPLAADPRVSRRILVVTGQLTAADMATLNTNIDTLTSELDQSTELTLKFGDRSDRHIYGWWEGMEQLQPTGREFGTPAGGPFMKLRLMFAILDPFWYATSTATVSGIQSTYTDIPNGTAPTQRDFVMTLTGNGDGTSSDPQVDILDEDGSTVQKTINLTANIGASETRVLDFDAGTVVDQASANKVDDLDSGTDFMFKFHSHWSDFRNSSWAQAKITNTGSQMDLDVQIRKAYY